jgi:hypothetical protein
MITNHSDSEEYKSHLGLKVDLTIRPRASYHCKHVLWFAGGVKLLLGKVAPAGNQWWDVCTKDKALICS